MILNHWAHSSLTTSLSHPGGFDVDKMEKVIWEHGVEGRMLLYQALLMESGVDKEVLTRTI